MAKCRRCGIDVYWSDRICTSCMQKWRKNRQLAYAQTISEMGKQTNENSKQFIKRLKQIEKSLK